MLIYNIRSFKDFCILKLYRIKWFYKRKFVLKEPQRYKNHEDARTSVNLWTFRD